MVYKLWSTEQFSGVLAKHTSEVRIYLSSKIFILMKDLWSKYTQLFNQSSLLLTNTGAVIRLFTFKKNYRICKDHLKIMFGQCGHLQCGRVLVLVR